MNMGISHQLCLSTGVQLSNLEYGIVYAHIIYIYTYNIIICMYIHIIWDNPEELSENLINHDTS